MIYPGTEVQCSLREQETLNLLNVNPWQCKYGSVPCFYESLPYVRNVCTCKTDKTPMPGTVKLCSSMNAHCKISRVRQWLLT